MGRHQDTTVEEWDRAWESGTRDAALYHLTQAVGQDVAGRLLPLVYESGRDRTHRGVACLGEYLRSVALVLNRYRAGKIARKRTPAQVAALIEPLYDADYNRLVGFLYKRGLSCKLTWEDAQDYAAESFAQLSSDLLRGDPIDNPRAMLYAVGKTLLERHQARTYKYRAFPGETWDEGNDRADHSLTYQDKHEYADPLAYVLRKEEIEHALALVRPATEAAGLPPIAIEAAALRWYNHQGLKTISDELGLAYDEVYRYGWDTRITVERSLAGMPPISCAAD